MQRVHVEFVPSGIRARILAEQMAGPVLMILVTASMFVLILRQREIHWLIGLLGLIGVVYAGRSSAAVSHDFSHTVFHECSYVYGNTISWACTAVGLSFVLICILNRRCFHPELPVLPKVTAQTMRWMALTGVLTIAAGPLIVRGIRHGNLRGNLRTHYLDGASDITDFLRIPAIGGYLAWKADLLRRDMVWLEFQASTDSEKSALEELAEEAGKTIGVNPLISWNPSKQTLGITIPDKHRKWFEDQISQVAYGKSND